VYLKVECDYHPMDDDINAHLDLSLVSTEYWEYNNKDIGYKKVEKFTNKEMINSK
jgi:hypothetical protein